MIELTWTGGKVEAWTPWSTRAAAAAESTGSHLTRVSKTVAAATLAVQVNCSNGRPKRRPKQTQAKIFVALRHILHAKITRLPRLRIELRTLGL